jgi:hypothetical protein
MEKILLISHASAGLITLIAGISAMIFPKKLKIHRPSGKIFYYAMWYVLVTAFILAFVKSNVFLFLVGVLVFNSNTMGLQSLKLYKSKNPVVGWKEWTIWLVSVALLSICQFYLIRQYGLRFDGGFVVINVFSLVLLASLLKDLNLLIRKNYTKKQYLVSHIGKMGGAFIGAITAAMVQNVQSDPVWIAWLLPTVIFTPVLIYYSRSVRKGTFWKVSKSKFAPLE